MSKELKEIYGAERVLKIKTFLEMIVYTDELSKINLEYLMDNAEVLLYAIKQAERVEGLENHLKLYDFWYRTAYEQNKRYREAKKQIEEKYEYFQDVPSSVSTGLSMAIEILDKALEGGE